MNRLRLTIACLSAVAWTQASAQNLSPDAANAARAHAAKTKHAAPLKSASRDELHFSDPYGPPEGVMIARKSSGLPGYSYPVPKEPQPSLSISMQKDGGGHTTGGFGWNF